MKFRQNGVDFDFATTFDEAPSLIIGHCSRISATVTEGRVWLLNFRPQQKKDKGDFFIRNQGLGDFFVEQSNTGRDWIFSE